MEMECGAASMEGVGVIESVTDRETENQRERDGEKESELALEGKGVTWRDSR